MGSPSDEYRENTGFYVVVPTASQRGYFGVLEAIINEYVHLRPYLIWDDVLNRFEEHDRPEPPLSLLIHHIETVARISRDLYLHQKYAHEIKQGTKLPLLNYQDPDQIELFPDFKRTHVKGIKDPSAGARSIGFRPE